MKQTIFISPIVLTTFALILFSSCSSTQPTPAEAQPLSYQVFYDDLLPYGTWIDYPNYGPVWNPNLDGDFRPYLTNGHWVATTAGWTWASDYRWGWAPFHYGRWLYDTRFGWLWVPGYEWSPAWVTWGTMDDYYCWAPLLPEVDVTIVFDTWSPSLFYWNICPRGYITNTHLHHVATGGVRGGTRINPIRNYETTGVHHHYYSKGPAIEEVQRATRTTVHPVPLETIRKAPNRTSSERVRVYRPAIETPEIQQHRESTPSPTIFRNGVTTGPPVNVPGEPSAIPRHEQQTNIRSLPQEHRATRR